MSRRGPIVLLLAIATAIALAPAASAIAAEAPIVRTVSVTAKAVIIVPNDSARLGLAVAKERRSRGAALRATSARLRRVIHAVKRVGGVGPGDVKTGRISIRKVSRGERTVFRASQGIGVILELAANAGKLVDRGIAAGATGVSGPYFFIGDTEAAEAKALGAAFDEAKARAKALAAKAGGKIGPALEIDEGELRGEFLGSSFTKAVNEVYAPAAPPPAPEPPPPTKPGSSKVRATVHVVFELL
jgi:uncharacterized protein YggE